MWRGTVPHMRQLPHSLLGQGISGYAVKALLSPRGAYSFLESLTGDLLERGLNRAFVLA